MCLCDFSSLNYKWCRCLPGGCSSLRNLSWVVKSRSGMVRSVHSFTLVHLWPSSNLGDLDVSLLQAHLVGPCWRVSCRVTGQTREVCQHWFLRSFGEVAAFHTLRKVGKAQKFPLVLKHLDLLCVQVQEANGYQKAPELWYPVMLHNNAWCHSLIF